jgi:hypothetical protein
MKGFFLTDHLLAISLPAPRKLAASRGRLVLVWAMVLSFLLQAGVVVGHVHVPDTGALSLSGAAQDPDHPLARTQAWRDAMRVLPTGVFPGTCACGCGA